jgi:hypothetical protein
MASRARQDAHLCVPESSGDSWNAAEDSPAKAPRQDYGLWIMVLVDGFSSSMHRVYVASPPPDTGLRYWVRADRGYEGWEDGTSASQWGCWWGLAAMGGLSLTCGPVAARHRQLKLPASEPGTK